jgi:AsmA protein
MRLSAAKVTAGNSKFGRTALAANLRNGTLALTIGEAQMFGGVLQGSVGLAQADTTADVKAQIHFADVDLEMFAAEMFGNRKLAGRGNLNVALEASGSSAYELTQSLSGTLTLTGHDGALNGFDVAQLLQRLENQPLSATRDFRRGRTPFDRLNVVLKVDKGVAAIDDALIEGPSARLTLSGNANVPSRVYDMKGVASLVSAPDTPPAFALPFMIQGPWDDPLVFPDSRALIRLSPASAPLLDAARDSRTRDTVRSVIDRLKGGAKPAADAAAPAANQN